MRRLYFDIDGTIVHLESGIPKLALSGGALGRAIRAAGIDELVCVGNFVAVIRTLWMAQPDYDAHGAILSLCPGTFEDEAWFRANTRFVLDPARRAHEIDLSTDWWYVDDCAERFCADAGRLPLYQAEFGQRILRPTPTGDGRDVLDWLSRIPPIQPGRKIPRSR